MGTIVLAIVTIGYMAGLLVGLGVGYMWATRRAQAKPIKRGKDVGAVTQEMLEYAIKTQSQPDAFGRGLCLLPPAGWWCSRGAGHEGPCAARCTCEFCQKMDKEFGDFNPL